MLELFYKENSINRRIHINEDNKIIEKMIEYIREKTGIYIDPYSDTKLYPSHLILMVSFLFNYKNQHIDLIKFLEEAINLDTIVYCIGN